MNDERANEIRAALDDYDDANVNGTTEEWLLKQAVITVEGPDWLRGLLAERERMVAGVKAARALVFEDWAGTSDLREQQDKYDRLREIAVTAYNALEG